MSLSEIVPDTATEFTASNGIHVGISEANCLIVSSPSRTFPAVVACDEFIDALREFFRNEEDERLGRWRWPEHPAYVFYPEVWNTGTKAVRIIRESDGSTGSWPIEPLMDTEGDFPDAARAYVAAHAEPKPWHDAKPGELWVIRLGEEDEQGVMVETFDAGPDVFQVPDGESISITHPSITAGRRVWPGVSS